MQARRSKFARIIITTVMVLGLLVLYSIVRRTIVVPAVGDEPILVDVLVLIVPATLTALLAPFVSYRAIDGLAWLVPPLGFVLFVRIAWRLALLPERDWPPRPDEVSRHEEQRAT